MMAMFLRISAARSLDRASVVNVIVIDEQSSVSPLCRFVRSVVSVVCYDGRVSQETETVRGEIWLN